MLVFIILCRGIRSYGRFILGLSILPIIGLIVVCGKFISVLGYERIMVNLFFSIFGFILNLFFSVPNRIFFLQQIGQISF